jgi:hypothetical protein
MTDQKVVAELRRIAAEHDGLLNPSDVVQAARPKASPLHGKFEWDDSEAAERYRLWQARQLISVTVEYIGGQENGMLSRVFVSLTSDRKEDGGYRTIDAVLSKRSDREQLLQDALDDMETFKNRYREIKELTEVFAAMRKVRVKIPA